MSKIIDRERRVIMSNRCFNRRKIWWLSAALLGSVVLIFVNTQGILLKYYYGMQNGARDSLAYQVLLIGATTYDAAIMSINSFRALLDRGSLQEKSLLPSIHLRVELGAIEQMASNLPISAKAKYYRAQMLYADGVWRNIKFRFRGRNIWHWHPSKPSLRVRLSRKNPLNLQRHINFINPEDRTMIGEIGSEELARELGVLTPITRMVRLFINNEYRGVYQQTTREDENMLYLNQRIPGPLFIGHELGNPWLAKQFEVAGETKILQRISPIDMMIEAIYAPHGPMKYKKLWNIVDLDKLARWQAAMNLVGGIHTDVSHNHLYYFDPTVGLLEPVTSDINGYATLLYPRARDRLTQPYEPEFRVPLNERLQPLLDVALRYPIFHHYRNRILYDALHGAGSVEEQHSRLDKHFTAIAPDAYADHRKSAIMATFVGMFRVPYSNLQYQKAKQQVIDWIEKRNGFLIGELDKVQVRVHISQPNLVRQALILVEVEGNAAVRFDPSILGGSIHADTNFDGSFAHTFNNEILLYPGLKEDHEFYFHHTRLNRSGDYYLLPDIQRYLFTVEGEELADLGSNLSKMFRHSLTGKLIIPEIESHADIVPEHIQYNTVSLHIWKLPIPKRSEIVLGPGIVTLTDNLFVEPGQRLVVRPGTRLRLAEGISIAARGLVQIVGTAEEPIIVERSNSNHAWGVIAIQGPATTGSEIAYTRISGGSVQRIFNIDYSGMVSVHWAGDFHLRNSWLGQNVQGDDTLHVTHTHVTINDGDFSNCFGDCVDFDYVSGSIVGLQIQNAGNDGIDFMTSQVDIMETSIDGAVDKGVSIGEASKISLSDLSVHNTKTGIAVKDRSRVVLRDSSLEKNFVAVDVYAKNWRYGGPGTVEFENTTFGDNEVDLRTAKGGRALFRNQPLPIRLSGNGSVKVVEGESNDASSRP